MTLIDRPRASIEVSARWAAKTFLDSDRLERELEWSRRVPWLACPTLGRTGDTLVMERLDMAPDLPGWRPVHELRAALLRLGAEGVHHRDCHILNIGRDRHGAPRLIDWEWAIAGLPGRSYDLFGPDISGVPQPEAWWEPHWWWGLHEEAPGRWWSVSGPEPQAAEPLAEPPEQ